MKIALISGTSIARSALFADWADERIPTRFGDTVVRRQGDLLVLNRHGFGTPLPPPHRINHRANIQALADLGFRDVLSLNSVGSLKPEIKPGTIVSCSDYVCLQQGPATFFDDELKGGAPTIANNLIPRLVSALAPEFEILTDKVYVQLRGPRFDTRAEIAVVRHWGDVIGMTAAHEADLCTEIGLRYNSLAMADNYANGIEGERIDFERFREHVQRNQEKINRLLARTLSLLAAW